MRFDTTAGGLTPSRRNNAHRIANLAHAISFVEPTVLNRRHSDQSPLDRGVRLTVTKNNTLPCILFVLETMTLFTVSPLKTERQLELAFGSPGGLTRLRSFDRVYILLIRSQRRGSDEAEKVQGGAEQGLHYRRYPFAVRHERARPRSHY